ncbi:MAG TPA: hypothetical protein VEC16_01050 [Alphaproteobacteria bacterium]|nr:hypothetical protein [Alphaproteobacteria bacterium]
MKKNMAHGRNIMNGRSRIVDLLEKYEENDFFHDRAGYLENSRLNIRDEIIA